MTRQRPPEGGRRIVLGRSIDSECSGSTPVDPTREGLGLHAVLARALSVDLEVLASGRWAPEPRLLAALAKLGARVAVLAELALEPTRRGGRAA